MILAEKDYMKKYGLIGKKTEDCELYALRIWGMYETELLRRKEFERMKQNA